MIGALMDLYFGMSCLPTQPDDDKSVGSCVGFRVIAVAHSTLTLKWQMNEKVFAVFWLPSRKDLSEEKFF